MAQAYATETGHDGSGPESRTDRMRRALTGLRHDRGIWRRGLVLAAIAVLIAMVMGLHARVPNAVGNLGSLVETFLPWLGLGIPVVIVLAFVRRSATALIATVLPVVVWLNMFGGLVFDKSGSGGDLTVVTHNVNAENTDPGGTAAEIAASGADVVALEELTQDDLPAYREALAGTFKYRTVEGTVGVWSKYPLSDSKAVDIKLGWSRALRTTVATPEGKVAVFAAHLPSVRVKLDAGFTAGQRDRSAQALGVAIRDEPLDRVILLGDLNGTMNDRALSPVTSQLRSTQGAAGDGFGFSWPAAFPMARIDQIMVRGVEPESSWALGRTDSDHLPLAASVRL
ncbi:Endonuclease/Exonuclease/phosphatase family protein [Streptomyces sp. YIM 130001]|uniref:endonuclease/exonuclease/phosphatase family protein n=1 Tax=Streptomyces sp. YIM 130001 TaxID=2259644 RepID=UPI000E65B2DF|nr:endonuclease/exonuclease/phosphatase family protein [Streptomyces sp. YIM 130001]RII17069.1 Endonuclease/Exonuclease/phosphatase family protein [Streptomyces sp. YIM 130001]